MAYTPYPGNKVPFEFDGTVYVVPLGNKVPFRFGGLPGTVFAVGWDSVAFGSAAAFNATSQLFPQGWDSSFVSGNLVLTKSLLVSGIPPGAVGTATIYNSTRYLSPFAVVPGLVGTHRIYLATIFPVGFNAFQGFGTAWVSLGTRRISTVTLGDQSKFGTAAFAGGVRWLDVAGRGIAPGAFGTARAWFRVRELLPLWFVATQYGRPALDFNHFVNPAGFGGEAIGQAEVYRPRFIVDLAGRGIAGPAWGDHRVDLHTQHAGPLGWLDGGATEAERFGRPLAYNLTQYLQQLFEVTPGDGGVFGSFNYVDNHNKVVSTEGMAPGKLGTAEIRNNARIVSTPAYVEFTRWGDALVADAIRTLSTRGADTSQWGSAVGMIVYNDGRVLAPQGIAAGDVGKPGRVWSNLQTLKMQGFDQSEHGTGMVAFAIRTVAPYSLPEPPPFGNVLTDLWIRYLPPQGIAASRYGVPTLEIHRTIIAPASVLPPSNAFGTGRVWNLTPELHAYGWSATLWGAARLHNQFERYAFEGWDSLEFGRHVVKDRRQTVLVPGYAPPAISTKHQVRKVMPDPPAPQTIEPGDWTDSRMGGASVRSNVLFPAGFTQATYGTLRIVSNGILPRGITPPYDDTTGVQCGIPALNRTPVILPGGIPSPVAALPDVGPRYVWAPMGYPYTTGYWDERGELMDNRLIGNNNPTRPFFGLASVTHRHRTLSVTGTAFGGYGLASLSLNPQYVRPGGPTFQRFGFPVLNGGGDIETYGDAMAVYGRPIVIIPDYGPKTARPGGIAAGAFGRGEVQLFNRELLAKGWISFTVSAPVPPSWPRASTWVSNAYAPFPAAGSDHARYGTPWVSHRVRTVAPAGWQSELLDWSPGAFKDRMRVTKQMRLQAHGASAGAAGVPWISNRLRTLAPPSLGNTLEYGLVNVRKQNRVNVPGFDALVFGDVQRWEAGTIKAHGDELALIGRAVIQRVIGAVGMAGNIGAPRLAHGIGAGGIVAPTTPTPTAVARWCGDKALAAGSFESTQMGNATVST